MVLSRLRLSSALHWIFILIIASCIEPEEDEVIHCSDPDYPYWCPVNGKCCSFPFYGKQQNSCYASLADCGANGQSCESCFVESSNSGGTSYYANWTCGSSSQCATVMGASNGTAGPFCDQAACDAWGKKYIPAGYTCSTTATQSPSSGSPPNGKCFKIGDF